jgi:hypothetical protein
MMLVEIAARENRVDEDEPHPGGRVWQQPRGD